MARKDKNDATIFKHLCSLKFEKDWDNYTENKYINEVLSIASKKNSEEIGIPDHIYVNENKKLLILLEAKTKITQHVSSVDESSPEKFAVDGVKHYLSFFLNNKLKSDKLKEFFKFWNFVGIAVSGDISDEYNHMISTFVISDDKIKEQYGLSDIVDESDYLSLFENIDMEKDIEEISASSKRINKWLRSVNSQDRPVLLSALMICLFDNPQNDFKNGYNSWSAKTIIQNIPLTLETVLQHEDISKDKIDLIKTQLGFLIHDQDLNNSDIIKDMLNELRDNVIPLFSRKSNYDIIGKFYEEFLRYAGVANVKKGIVLTPRHITTLFTELIDIKSNDVFIDPACGTGSFLISAMNKLIELINISDVPNKKDKIQNIKTRQLIGIEKNPTMYSLAISNMLFRGDGKSRIYYSDFFSDISKKEIDDLAKEGIIPTIGFINPPYGGKDNKDNPTKKEIQFLTRLLELDLRYVIIIAPLSTYFQDEKIRNNILKTYTLKLVINMPKDLFMPNAATNTAIAVFEKNPHGDQEVVFYDLKDDGFVLSKSKGRTDSYNKWFKIKSDMLRKLSKPEKYKDDITLVKTKIKKNDEWLIQAHSKTDYSKLNENSFISSIKNHMIFKAKHDLNLLEKDLDEITILDIVSDYYSKENSDDVVN